MEMSNFMLSLAGLAARWLPMSVKQSIYRVPWLSGIVRNSLNRSAPSGITQVSVAGGILSGYQLALDLTSEKDYWLGTYEPELQSGIQRFVYPGMTVYDLGANIGYITLMMVEMVGDEGQVIAFEALPGNLDRLRNNLALNGRQDKVEVVAGAVVDRAGPVNFWIGPSGGMGKAEGSQGRSSVSYSESITVEGLALDDYVYRQGNPEPQVVKMDIEGGEVLALPGMRQVLVQARPLLFLELHGPEAARTAWQELTAAAYRVCYLEPRYRDGTDFAGLDWKTYLVAFPPGFDFDNRYVEARHESSR
jgi:FkbM family methyltransferase